MAYWCYWGVKYSADGKNTHKPSPIVFLEKVKFMEDNCKIAVVGLGYVGLPLAIHFGEKFDTVGFDLKEKVIANCRKKEDPTGEVSREEFERAGRFTVTCDPTMLCDADYIVVAVPTPIDQARRPDLGPVKGASCTVGRHMKKGAIVVFESTVYPGVTEELCVPILEKDSGLTWKEDFHVGYSPERNNPGDKEHTLTKIVKVVSGDDVIMNALGCLAGVGENEGRC